MATFRSWVQDINECHLCGKSSIEFCNSCQLNLCVNCVSKHVDKFRTLSHDIVPFKNKKIHWVFPECKFHRGQRCEVHCQDCQTPICIKCCIGAHKHHNALEIVEVVEIKKQEIRKDIEEIETKLIPEYKKINTYLQGRFTKITVELTNTEQEKEKLRTIWHQEVDTIFDKLGILIQAMKKSCLENVTAYQTKIKNLIQDMTQSIQENKQFLKTSKPLDVFNYKSNLNEYRNVDKVDVKYTSLKANIADGKELSIEMGETKALLTHTSLSNSAVDVFCTSQKQLLTMSREIAVIPTGYKPLRRMVCMGDNEAWIIGSNKTITRVDIHGSVKETVVTNCRLWPDDISVTNQDELIYSDCNRRTVNIIRTGQCKIEVLITTPWDWIPSRMHCTRSGDILVSMFNGQKKKIIRYHGKKKLQVIEKDNDDKPIFEDGNFVLYLTENNNGDVCASDMNAGVLVAIDMEGRVRFRYNGTPIRKKDQFSPRNIVTDSLSQIIVTDYNNSCLHILDQNGDFLKCLECHGLNKINALSLDSDGRLWAGLFESGEIKVIQYLN